MLGSCFSCVIAELRKLGADFSGTLSVARKLDAAKCDHEPLKSASDCLESLIADGNLEHFFVATQDAELRIKLRQVPSVAIILAQNNFLVLEPPSEKQQSIAHANEAQKTHATKREFQIIEARERKKEALLAAKSGEGDTGIATRDEPNNKTSCQGTESTVMQKEDKKRQQKLRLNLCKGMWEMVRKVALWMEKQVD
ncbi:hypothetical protein GOP47_0016652 [Adiantum capillus-veneris]|uniref:Uncharacterized protein n=1 Tax=Adiantum capillus-veneris TaxID=13818 RepID=A0A9D4UIQ9_ADICA|nr:hypothetical protein GOP47_0016652 [Adiantum capillus-veneris]